MSLCSIAARNGVLNSVCASTYTECMWARPHTHTHTHTHTYIFQNCLSSQHTYSVTMRYYNYSFSAINCKLHHVAITTYSWTRTIIKVTISRPYFKGFHYIHSVWHLEGICLTSLLHATEGESLNKDITWLASHFSASYSSLLSLSIHEVLWQYKTNYMHFC
jgi:hypothetical protein